MSSDPVVSAHDLGKDYRIYDRPIDRVREMYSIRGREYHSVFTALHNVTFDVAPGETVGIIGPNGSGKSTLLEIICGTLNPSRGHVSVTGRLAALLELGAGFNPAFSGRENVYLNAALLGISREEIDDRFTEIVDFAGIGEFIDHPVSTYSSGMYVRLAFATAVNSEPEILIVDEALAVGDIRFQRKCFRRFQEMQRAGKTILFVTHSVELVQAHCSRGIYLKSGEIRALGEPKAVIQEYLEDLFGVVGAQESDSQQEDDNQGLQSAKTPSLPGQQAVRQETAGDDVEISRAIASERILAHFPEDLCSTRAFYNPNEYRWGDQRAVIYDYLLSDVQGPIRQGVERGQKVVLEVSIFFPTVLEDIIFGFTIKTVDGRTVFGANTRERGLEIPQAAAGQCGKVRFEFVCALIPGEYFLSVGIAQDDSSRDNIAIDRRYDLIYMPVIGARGDFGIADVNLSIDCLYD
ncbi:MAG TPA: sugar ABC transporter ATP-binding protein, partial [Gammaproteobacteria bacterium]|nr:sugar ABC transporter ATP-binding protein [Gammaproteobacteria bacterium]